MVAIKIENFGGEIPAIDDRLLPQNMAAVAINSWLFSGRVEPVHALVELYTPLSPGTRSWFRLPKDDPSIDNMSESWWLEFQNQNVRVIRSPISGQDNSGRYYWADGVYPKMMTGDAIMQSNAVTIGAWNSTTTYAINDAVTSGGQTYVALTVNTNQPPATNPDDWIIKPGPRKLGVPPPGTAPGITPSGGVSTTNYTVSYVYTWVSDLGEEGPPSPANSATNKIDATYTITMSPPGIGDTDGRSLTRTRIYRTVTSVQGVATYFFVVDLPIATLTYVDNHTSMTDALVVNNEQLITLYWHPPPVDLQGLVSMPNGMVAGWRKNEVWFCEPYFPHAWPVPYTIAVPSDIVGLGVFNQSLIILCEGQPYSATGVDPSAMALAIIQPLEPCTSRLSIVNTPAGVLYSSPNGLIQITPAGAVNLTLSSISKDQWPKLLNLNNIAAGILALGYYAYSVAGTGVFQNDAFAMDENPPDEYAAFQPDSNLGVLPGIYQKLDDTRMALTPLQTLPTEVKNVITDLFNGELMVMRDGIINVIDIRSQEPYATYRWRSKIFMLNHLSNLAAAKVYWIRPDVNDTRTAKFRVFAGEDANALQDGLPLRFEQEMTVPGQMFRLPSGYKALYWQFEVEGTIVVTAIHAASSARELRAI